MFARPSLPLAGLAPTRTSGIASRQKGQRSRLTLTGLPQNGQLFLSIKNRASPGRCLVSNAPMCAEVVVTTVGSAAHPVKEFHPCLFLDLGWAILQRTVGQRFNLTRILLLTTVESVRCEVARGGWFAGGLSGKRQGA